MMDVIIWACDFEHPTCENFEKGNVASVATSLFIAKAVFCNECPLDSSETTIDTKFDGWFGLFKKEYHNIVYFHNINYDGIALIHWLQINKEWKNKYDYFQDNEQIYEISVYRNEKDYLNRHGDQTELNDKGKVVKIKKSTPFVEFRCSMKILGNNTSIDSLGKMFGFPKEKINYNTLRHYEKIEDVPVEWTQYAKRDVDILAIALRKFLPKLREDGKYEKTKLTISAFAKSDCIEKIGYGFYHACLKVCQPWKFFQDWCRERELGGVVSDKEKYNNFLDKILPEQMKDEKLKKQWHEEEVNHYRTSYFGGLTSILPLYRGKDVLPFANSQIFYYDINSSYPYVMTGNLPFGKGLKRDDFFKKFPTYRGKIIKSLYIKMTKIKPKNERSLPCIPIGNSTGKDAHYFEGEWEGRKEFYVYEELLRTWEKQWIIEYEVCSERSLYYQAKPYLKGWVEEWFKVKQHGFDNKEFADIVEKHLAKLAMNSLYGKWGQDTERNQSVGLEECTYKNEELNIETTYYKSVKEEEINVQWDGSYLPLASYVTAIAQKNLLDVAFQCDIIYCDTDSIFSLTPIPDEYINKNDLGKWKDECLVKKIRIIKFKVLRPKCYAIEFYYLSDTPIINETTGECIQTRDSNNKPIIYFNFVISGLPRDGKDGIKELDDEEKWTGEWIQKPMSWEDFYIGKCFESKLTRWKKYGWVCLKTTTFTI